METAILKLADIKAAAYNPRKALRPGDEDYERLKNSITEFGFVEPVIVNKRNMTLVGGHQRYRILEDIGETETEAVMVDLDDAAEKTLNIALNKIEGEWDIDKLKDILSELSAEDVMKTSFGETEIDDLLKDIQEAQDALSAEAEDEPDEESSAKSAQEDQEAPAKGFEIYLSFTTQEAAEEWIEAHGLTATFNTSRNVLVTVGGGKSK